MRPLRLFLVSFLCFAIGLVATGAARVAHEAIEHAHQAAHAAANACDGDDASAHERGPVSDADHDDAVPADSPGHQHGSPREGCVTCLTLASLGQMPQGPPADVCPILDLRPSALAPVSSGYIAPSTPCLDRSAPPRGPPLI